MYLALIQKVASRTDCDIAPYSAQRILNLLDAPADTAPVKQEDNEEHE
jgi:hypothetical protein